MNMGRRCAACKYLRRKCPPNCIFALYFPSNNPQRFACVHRIYGAKNVAKMLQDLPADRRGEAADSLQFEAQQRIEEPMFGCVGIISQLYQEILNAETQLAKTRAKIALIRSNIPNAMINFQDQNQNDHHDDHVLQVVDSNLNQLNLQGQSSNSAEPYSSQFGQFT